MDIKGRSPGIIVIILILVLLIAASSGFYLYHQEHLKNVDLEERFEELNTKYKIGEAKLLEAQKILSSLEAKLKESDSRISDLSNELEKERADKENVSSSLEQFKLDLEAQKGLRSDLENRLKRVSGDLQSAQDKLALLEAEKKDLEAKAQEVNKEGSAAGIELGKIIVKDEAVKASPSKAVDSSTPQVEGKILVLNKEYNFVVINLGSKDGVAMGQVFSVYRGNNYLGDIKVEKLHDSMAAAGFASEDIKGKVREGDRIVQKG